MYLLIDNVFKEQVIAIDYFTDKQDNDKAYYLLNGITVKAGTFYRRKGDKFLGKHYFGLVKDCKVVELNAKTAKVLYG